MENNTPDMEELYNLHGPMVYRRCLIILKNEDQALDTMQEIFLEIWERPRKISHPVTYLFTMATTRSLNKIKRQKKIKLVNSDEFLEEIPDPDLSQKELLWTIQAWVESLDERPALLFRLRYQDERTIQDIAEILDLSLGGVHKQLQNLKSEMKKWGEKNGIF